jgi:hypothetical protein
LVAIATEAALIALLLYARRSLGSGAGASP